MWGLYRKFLLLRRSEVPFHEDRHDRTIDELLELRSQGRLLAPVRGHEFWLSRHRVLFERVLHHLQQPFATPVFSFSFDLVGRVGAGFLIAHH